METKLPIHWVTGFSALFSDARLYEIKLSWTRTESCTRTFIFLKYMRQDVCITFLMHIVIALKMGFYITQLLWRVGSSEHSLYQVFVHCHFCAYVYAPAHFIWSLDKSVSVCCHLPTCQKQSSCSCLLKKKIAKLFKKKCLSQNKWIHGEKVSEAACWI